MGTLAEERMKVCQNHPEKQEIFKLEALLIEAEYPYFFNFWEDIRGVFGGTEEDPECINWDTYPFWMEIEDPATKKLVEVRFNQDWDPTMLDVEEVVPGGSGASHIGLSAGKAIEVIKNYFEGAK